MTFINEELHTGGSVPVTDLGPVVWYKSKRSQGISNCVELAELPDGGIAVRNSRFPDGEALVYTRAEMSAFVLGAKDGEFDHLI